MMGARVNMLVACMLALVTSHAAGRLCRAEEAVGGPQQVVGGPDTTGLAAAAGDSIPARTGEQESSKVYKVDDVLITANRLLSSYALHFSDVSVATERDIEEVSSATVAEALVTDSGVGLMRYGSYGSLQTMSMRGGGSNEIVFLLDGVPLSDPQIAVVDLNWLPMSGVSRVEVMKGGASSLYGSGAMGGAVNLVSVDGGSDLPTSEVTAWTGSFDSRSVGITLRRPLAGRVGLVACYDYLKSSGWLPNSASRGEKLYGKVSPRVGEIAIDAVGFKHTGETRVPGTDPGVQKDNRAFLDFSVSRVGKTSMKAVYYRSSSDLTYEVLGGCYKGFSSKHEKTLDGLQAEASFGSSSRAATSCRAGYELRRIVSSSAGKRSASDLHLSLQQEMNWDPWRLCGSLRVERSSQFDVEVSPQAMVWLSLGKNVVLFSKADRGFTYPSFDDLYWKGPKEAGDPGLKTEHSTGFETGVLLENAKFDLGGTAYYRLVDDLIAWRVVQPCSLVKSTNMEATLSGLEFSLRFVPAHGAEASLSYWMGAATDASGMHLEYKPANILAWRARAERQVSRHVSCGLVLAGRHVSKVNCGNQAVYSTDNCFAPPACEYGASLPHYSSGLLYAYLAVDRGRVFCRINNLFDGQIATTWSRPQLLLPSRSYEVGLALNLRD